MNASDRDDQSAAAEIDSYIPDVVSENDRLRQANEALRARMERVAPWPGGDPQSPARLADKPGEQYLWLRRYVDAGLEAANEALALFTEEGRLLAANRKLHALFPDVAPRLAPGLRVEDALKIISGARALDLPNEIVRATWAEARIASLGRPSSPIVAPLIGDRWVEFSERRVGQGGSAIAFFDVTEAVQRRRRERNGGGAEIDAPSTVGVLESLDIGVGAFDRDARMLIWNDAFRALLGLGLSDLSAGASFDELGRRIIDSGVIPAEGEARRISDWVAGSSPRAPLSVEIRRADGATVALRGREASDGSFVIELIDVTAERRAVEEVARARETLENRVLERTSALVEVNDKLVQEIAERRALEAEMRRARDAAEAANLSKTRFLAAASHDLLQPLNAAKLFVSALNDSNLPPDEAAIAKRVESAFNSVETLLNALLDISKLDAGAREVEPTSFPISRILEPIADEFGPLAESAGLRLRVAPCAAVVRSDPQYLRRIVQNLVANALKYTVDGGVVVGCRRRGDTLRIEVWDSGVGIPPTERRRIFEEFHRIDSANPRRERGMGLGLAIVDRAARLLRHRVDIRSQEGQGSVFSVTAQLGAADQVEAQNFNAPPLNLSLGEAGMIALVIDDDPAVRAATTQLLDRWGVDVLEAAGAKEAMAISDQLGMAPDVLLIDYHLGDDETGLDALALLRAAFDPDLPAIMITADRSRAVAREAEHARAQILTKPVEPSKLRSLLHWSRADRQMRVR